MMRYLTFALFLLLNEPIALAAGPFIWGPSNTAKNLQANAMTQGDFSSGTLSLVNGAGFLEYLRTSSTPATPAVNRILVYSDAAKQFTVMNSDGFKASFETGSITANRVYTLPPQSGRIALNLAAFTDGSIPFAASGVLTQDNANLFWDNANDRLGLGTATPNDQLELTLNMRIATTTIINMGASRFLFNDGDTTAVFLGVNSGNTTFTGIRATGIGSLALSSLAAGAQNTAVGYTAGSGVTDGNHGTYVGFSAQPAAATFSEVVAVRSGATATRQGVTIGYNACASLGSSSSWHTCIGKAAGSNDETGGVDVTAGNDSIFIGGNSGANTATPSNMVVIGNSAIGSGNNSATFGNYGHSEIVLGSDLFASAASIARTIRVGNAFGTDRAAGATSIQASRSTGTGAGGTLLFKTAPAAASTGSALNTAATIMTIGAGTSPGGGFVSIADTGANGGNVPHQLDRRTNTTATSATCTVDCSAGERALGGGCSNTVSVNLEDSFPADNDTWTCNYTLATGDCTAYAICADY